VPKTDPEPSARVPVPRGAAIFAGGGLLLAITALLIANGGGGESPSVRLSVQVPDLLLWAAATAFGISIERPEPARKEAAVPHAATGAFDVKMTPLKAEDGSTLARFALDKQYHGALDGKSLGEMLTAGTAVKNSAGYVAFETFTGTLDGRTGTFVLQHSATMTRGDGKLSITVVPDSGTGALEGLSGTMTIRIENGAHFYDFAYALP